MAKDKEVKEWEWKSNWDYTPGEYKKNAQEQKEFEQNKVCANCGCTGGNGIIHQNGRAWPCTACAQIV